MKDLSMFLKKVINLPEGIEFYEVDGQIVFPLSTKANSGISYDSIIYLTKKGDYNTGKGFYKYGILLSELILPYIEKFVKSIEENNAKEFNPDGGSLGFKE